MPTKPGRSPRLGANPASSHPTTSLLLHRTPAQTQREHSQRVVDRARKALGGAALLYASGEMDKLGYELARDAAMADLEAAEAELARLHPPTATTRSATTRARAE
jgi:hypothetical protein